ncbi:MAG: amino-acid N-acetyltransferase, partial [Pseudomonadales bacterium]
ELAAKAAVAVGADKLILFAQQAEMLVRQEQLVRELDLGAAKQVLQENSSDRGVQNVLAQAVYACEHKVARSHVISCEENGALVQELFSRAGSGTLVSQQSFETTRQASIDDINGIIELIEPLEADGTLVKRSREKLEDEIDRFTVVEREDAIIACAALYPYPDMKAGEIACVVTHADYRGEQRGEKLLAHLCTLARQRQLTTLFVLTTKAAHWFQEHGFEPNGIDALPPKRQSLYNLQRSSKVFVKQV